MPADLTAAPDAKSRIRVICHNGDYVAPDQATIRVTAPGLEFALLVFEGIRGYRNDNDDQTYVFRLKEHLDRLAFSCRMMRFDGAPTAEELAVAVSETIRRNDFHEDVYIRIQVYIDDWGDMNSTGPVGWDVIVRPRPRIAAFHEGRRFKVSSWRRLADDASPPRIKASANYLNSRLAGLEAKAAGYDNAILLNPDGSLAEGPGGCLFILRDGKLLTPGVADGILESVTRATLLELARDMGIPVEERRIGRTELHLASEGFYCGTGQEMTPMLSVDDLPLGDGKPGPVTRRLQDTYDRTVRGLDAGYPAWRTPVFNKGS